MQIGQHAALQFQRNRQGFDLAQAWNNNGDLISQQLLHSTDQKMGTHYQEGLDHQQHIQAILNHPITPQHHQAL